MESLQVASLLNIAECKMRRVSPDVLTGKNHNFNHRQSHSHMSLSSLSKISALEACDMANQIQDTVSGRLKKILTLEKMRR
jgi:hypothetical protein